MVQADIDALNTNDVIIIGRSTGSGAFSGAQGAQWNTAITKPVIVQSSFLIRNSRLGWFTADGSFNALPQTLTIDNGNDPEVAYVFQDVAQLGGVTVDLYDVAFGQNTSQTADAPVAGGNILARAGGTNNTIVEFPAGTAVKSGANILAGYRMYFASGNREPTGGTVPQAGSNNLTTAGAAIFRRAVELAISNGVAPNLGQAPVITLNPVGADACAGSTLILTSAATGELPLSYQWYISDGATFTNAVADGTNSTLTIANLQPATAGFYAVLATNVVGSATSSVAVVSIVGTATVASALTSQTNCPGTPITFTTTATGSGTLIYTWRKNGAVVQDPSTNNSPSFLIASAITADAGVYSVDVSGECNNVTNSATLTVVGAPTISAQPQNQTTPMGNGAVFSVTASTLATQPTTFQWQTNGIEVTGATGSSLAISNLTLAHNGLSVSVQLANCAGSTLSASAVLTVTPVSGISFDFDTPGQYTNAPYYLTYNNWINGGYLNGVPAPTVYESSIGGVGPFPGGGGLDMSPNQGTENTSILLPVNFDFSLTGKTVFASTMFKIKTPINGTRRATQFGLVTSTNLGINDQTPQGFATAILQSGIANNPTFDLRTQRRTSGGGIQESTNFVAPLTLTVSNWYKFNVTFLNTKSAANPSNYTMVVSLQDMGPLGTTPGATNASFISTTNTADIVNFKNVYLALRSFEDGGMEARDNTYVWTTPGNIFFVQAPQNQTVTQGHRAQFRALVDGEGPYSYTWQRDDGIGGFTNIPLAGSWNYVTPPARTSDNGAQIRVIVTGPANSITNDPVALTVTSLELAVVSAGSVDGTTVGVQFNQPVQQASAENVANYTINGAPPVQARVYRSSLGAQGPEGIYVLLTPASVLSGSFTVVATGVPGVQDLSGGSVGLTNSAIGTVAGLTGVDVNPLITGPSGENYSFGPGKFTVTGGGSDIFSGGDAFRYVYTAKTGDFDMVVRIPSMDTVRFTAKAGIDARISLDPFSPGVFAGFDPGPMAEGSGTLRQFTEGTAKQTWGAGGTS